ncbi:MAG: tRNA 2-selenouridine(34) synthase MnmH [Limnobacter sp.]|uniref:tRNA 2-selenouridine(34) synthase MnmH n=1 Tax=Limnobacter sp. TaxID=2003368 RepID=UPI0022CAA5ED|nr:tRNA 2-selenouridine(34) synthase MnmH [Limnobacter sp.]MCZ8015019.1 tRNA 2-selenouridine(34) synthase MnmH [Limnobacter sp.]
MSALILPRPAVRNPEIVSTDQLFEYAQIIDVRSPAEFEDDHVPGAINCPVLSNEERIRVGTLYKQVSPFDAKKVGAALVAKNIARHLEEQFCQHDKSWRPLIYCWRGGSRSGAMTHILRQVGWQASQLHGGYKVYRGLVLNELAELPKAFRYRVICGATGSAKSRLLEQIAAQGGQVLDLEGLACHKGSVLGVLPNQPQPAQKMFESRVWNALRQFDVAKPVFIEAESKKIGKLRLPEALFDAMAASGEVIQIHAPVEARVDFLLRDYDYFLKDPASLQTQLDYLFRLHGHAVINRWKEWAEKGEWNTLVTELLVKHYDPSYTRSTPHNLSGFAQARTLDLSQLSTAELSLAATELLSD